MTNPTSTHATNATPDETSARAGRFRRWLDANSHTDASAKALGRMSWPLRLMLRAIYAAGVIGLGWATFDLFVTDGGFPWPAALGVTIIIDSFVLVSAHYYVRARLRGVTAWHKAAVVYLGVLGSAGLQIAFHLDDAPVRAAGVSVAGVFALISWILTVNDEHAAIFEAQADAKRARRAARRARWAEILKYRHANGRKATKKEWKARTVAVGRVTRDVDTTLAVRAQEARANVVEGSVVNPTPVVGPFPPRAGVAGRPISALPATLADATDEHAIEMRRLWAYSPIGGRTRCIDYAWRVWGPDGSPAAIARWLTESYGVTVDRSTVSPRRPARMIEANEI